MTIILLASERRRGIQVKTTDLENKNMGGGQLNLNFGETMTNC